VAKSLDSRGAPGRGVGEHPVDALGHGSVRYRADGVQQCRAGTAGCAFSSAAARPRASKSATTGPAVANAEAGELPEELAEAATTAGRFAGVHVTERYAATLNGVGRAIFAARTRMQTTGAEQNAICWALTS
jgi:hypothetical protein